jgi:hypothetical protein
MTPERWQQIENLCHEALARPADARAAFLAEACAGDAALQREVESLVRQESSAADFMSEPAVTSVALEYPQGTLIGHRVGPYAIGALLGVGGMGEVYRAHDDALGRDVAIKVLAPAFTADPERRARFEREARLLAALNHPNIAAIYGVERGPVSGPADAGAYGGRRCGRWSWSSSKARRSQSASRAGAACRSPRRWPSRDRSSMRSRLLMKRGSSTAI